MEKQLTGKKDSYLVEGVSHSTVVDVLFYNELKQIFAVDKQVQSAVLSGQQFKTIPDWFKRMQKEQAK